MAEDAPVAVEETPVVAPVVETVVDPSQRDPKENLQEVLRQANYVGGLSRGLHEVCKVLSQGAAHLCVLAEDCDEAGITKLIEALCQEQNVPLAKVETKKQLGEWAGLCKIDADGNARKVVKCSCAAVSDYGRSEASFKAYLKQLK
eukprot:m.351328 g.351328  ORF g.351328 m.351328 type:complete len:146 (+) comp16224_c0_seq1:164-601(+)